MKKLAALFIAGLFLAGCGADSNSLTGGWGDLENIKPEDPYNVHVYRNVDGFPNVVTLCIKGVAFATTTRDLNSIFRVEEWDIGCKQ